jgi:hypothetical protein
MLHLCIHVYVWTRYALYLLCMHVEAESVEASPTEVQEFDKVIEE